MKENSFRQGLLAGNSVLKVSTPGRLVFSQVVFKKVSVIFKTETVNWRRFLYCHVQDPNVARLWP